MTVGWGSGEQCLQGRPRRQTVLIFPLRNKIKMSLMKLPATIILYQQNPF